MTLLRRLLPLVLALAASAIAPRVQAAQATCRFADAPVLDFGQPVANPTERVESTANVPVHCMGDAQAGGQTLQVCLVAPGNGTAVMRNGASRLAYGLFADSARSRPMHQPAGVIGVPVRLGSGADASADVRIPIYGLIPAGQSGLAGGLHTDRTLLQLRVASESDGTCGTAPVRDTHPLVVQARLPAGSCSVSAADLDFGRAYDLRQARDGTTAIGLTCTRGTAYTLALSGGGASDVQRRRMVGSGGAIGYQLYRDAARTRLWGDATTDRATGTGTGNPQTLTIYARVPSQATPPAGAYSDTVVATVTY